MATNVSLLTTDGRIIQGINFNLSPGVITPTVPALIAGMPGQMAAGTFHVQTPTGWVYIPASQIQAVLKFKAGAPT